MTKVQLCKMHGIFTLLNLNHLCHNKWNKTSGDSNQTERIPRYLLIGIQCRQCGFNGMNNLVYLCIPTCKNYLKTFACDHSPILGCPLHNIMIKQGRHLAAFTSLKKTGLGYTLENLSASNHMQSAIWYPVKRMAAAFFHATLRLVALLRLTSQILTTKQYSVTIPC